MPYVLIKHFPQSKIFPTKQHFKACDKGPKEAAALTTQMSSKKNLTHRTSIWISHLTHTRSYVILWPSSSEL